MQWNHCYIRFFLVYLYGSNDLPSWRHWNDGHKNGESSPIYKLVLTFVSHFDTSHCYHILHIIPIIPNYVPLFSNSYIHSSTYPDEFL